MIAGNEETPARARCALHICRATQDPIGEQRLVNRPSFAFTSAIGFSSGTTPPPTRYVYQYEKAGAATHQIPNSLCECSPDHFGGKQARQRQGPVPFSGTGPPRSSTFSSFTRPLQTESLQTAPLAWNRRWFGSSAAWRFSATAAYRAA